MHNDRFDQKNRSTQENKRKLVKQVYHVKKDGRLNKNSDLTLDIEKPHIEKSSASSVDQIVPNDKHVSKNIAEQKSSLTGGQDNPKSASSKGTGLTGAQPSLTGLARNSGGATNFMPKRDDQSGNSSSSKAKKHRRSSHWSSLFIPSMHVPWNAY